MKSGNVRSDETLLAHLRLTVAIRKYIDGFPERFIYVGDKNYELASMSFPC